MSAVDEVGGPDDESFEEMAERLNVLPSPERQVSQPLSPRESEALEDEFEVLGAQMTGNPTFSAEGGQPNPTTTYDYPSPPRISTSGYLASFATGTMFHGVGGKTARKQPVNHRPPTPKPDNEDQESESSEEDESGPPAPPGAQPSTSGASKRRRFKPGTVALKEIKRFQKSTDLLIPRTRFVKLVREIMGDVYPQHPLRIQREALEGLQEAAEYFLVGFLEDCNMNAIHAKRVTIQKKDGDLVKHYLNRLGMGGIKY